MLYSNKVFDSQILRGTKVRGMISTFYESESSIHAVPARCARAHLLRGGAMADVDLLAQENQ